MHNLEYIIIYDQVGTDHIQNHLCMTNKLIFSRKFFNVHVTCLANLSLL